MQKDNGDHEDSARKLASAERVETPEGPAILAGGVVLRVIGPGPADDYWVEAVLRALRRDKE